jgi:tetratricopeptide (TPR) repeat protein
MQVSPTQSGLRLAGARELLLPITVLACFGLYYGAEFPLWVVAAVAVPMLVLYALAPRWAARSVVSFDRDLVRLLSTGRRQALPGRYARALGMRVFSAAGVRAERRAVVAAENSDPREAQASYRAALREYASQPPLRVLLGYANACYALGDDVEAIRVYRELQANAAALPGVRRNLVHAMVRSGESLREALALLDDAARNDVGRARPADTDLMRAVAHAKLGEFDRARMLADAYPVVDGEFAISLRTELERVLDGATAPI